MRGLDAIEEVRDAVTFGAMVSHEAAIPHLAAIDPDLGELMRRFAGKQIRTVGTIGGNIANGSPIGDTPPALIALGATLTLQKGDVQRNLPLEDFFVAYGKQDRAAGEFVRSVRVPKLEANERFRCYKISKRFDQDISAAMGAFKFTLDGSRIEAARIAFGGMAATPKRARQAEAALAGADLANEASWQPAADCAGARFTPITDQRASAAYRGDVARALLRKALIEVGGTSTRETRIVGIRETADADFLITLPRPCRRRASFGYRPFMTLLRVTSAERPSTLTTSASLKARFTWRRAARPSRMGAIKRLDLDAVRTAPGVVRVITAADIPGRNDCSPIKGDDPILADERRRLPWPGAVRRRR